METNQYASEINHPENKTTARVNLISACRVWEVGKNKFKCQKRLSQKTKNYNKLCVYRLQVCVGCERQLWIEYASFPICKG